MRSSSQDGRTRALDRGGRLSFRTVLGAVVLLAASALIGVAAYPLLLDAVRGGFRVTFGASSLNHAFFHRAATAAGFVAVGMAMLASSRLVRAAGGATASSIGLSVVVALVALGVGLLALNARLAMLLESLPMASVPGPLSLSLELVPLHLVALAAGACVLAAGGAQSALLRVSKRRRAD